MNYISQIENEIKENIIKQDLYESNFKIEKKKEKKIINSDLYNEQLNKKIDFESKLKEDDLKLINSKKKNPYEENDIYKIINNIKKGVLILMMLKKKFHFVLGKEKALVI